MSRTYRMQRRRAPFFRRALHAAAPHAPPRGPALDRERDRGGLAERETDRRPAGGTRTEGWWRERQARGEDRRDRVGRRPPAARRRRTGPDLELEGTDVDVGTLGMRDAALVGHRRGDRGPRVERRAPGQQRARSCVRPPLDASGPSSGSTPLRLPAPGANPHELPLSMLFVAGATAFTQSPATIVFRSTAFGGEQAAARRAVSGRRVAGQRDVGQRGGVERRATAASAERPAGGGHRVPGAGGVGHLHPRGPELPDPASFRPAPGGSRGVARHRAAANLVNAGAREVQPTTARLRSVRAGRAVARHRAVDHLEVVE